MTARAEWVYRGVWGVIASWFRVPADPPSLPAAPGELVDAFHPSPGYIRYLKFWFWWILLLTDVPLVVGWVVLTILVPWLGLLLAIPAWALIVLPDIIAFVAIHLRYDSTWYVMGDRSIRLRRGIWMIREATITYENIQNVHVNQGPVQRHFGIADVVISTAGGGGAPVPGKGGANSHLGIIQGVHDAAAIRERVMAKVRRSRSAGLGDDAPEAAPRGAPWTPEHLALLRRIAASAEALAAR